MIEILKSYWDRAVSEGGVVSGAPLLFTLAVLFCLIISSVVIWQVIGWSYQVKLDGQIAIASTLNDRLRLKDDQIGDYKDKLNGATPAEAKKRLDALELQVLALSPRRLTNEQKTLISSKISGYKGFVLIESDMSAPDARPFAADLAATFQSARWKVSLPMLMGTNNPPPSGVSLSVKDPSNLNEIENAVRLALQSAGVDFDIQPFRRMPRPTGYGEGDALPDLVMYIGFRTK